MRYCSITDTGKIWIYDKIMRSISTVSIYNDLLFIADFSGNVRCLNPDCGKVYPIERGYPHMLLDQALRERPAAPPLPRRR